MGLTCSDIVSIACTIAAAVVTVVVALFQYRQGKRMEEFERRADGRDERCREEKIKAQASSFIAKNHSNRGLIPLCAIAAMHDDSFCYSRAMYGEFCGFSREVQNRILIICGLDLRVERIDGLFDQCLGALEKVLRERFPNDSSPFYDNGKYLIRSLERYGGEEIPVKHICYCPKYYEGCLGGLVSAYCEGMSEYHVLIDEVLSASFQLEEEKGCPIEELKQAYNFQESSEIDACQFVTTLAMLLALHASRDNTDKQYGSPGSYSGETIDTMEDLFLLSLFEIYTNLLVDEEASSELKLPRFVCKRKRRVLKNAKPHRQ